MNTENRDSEIIRQLTAWFMAKLDEENIQFEDEPMSYDGSSQYDARFYQLQSEAARFWQRQYGFVPTPGQLMKGFFGAEFERSRRMRLANRTWLQKLQEWCFGRVSSGEERTDTDRFHA